MAAAKYIVEKALVFFALLSLPIPRYYPIARTTAPLLVKIII
jgi:hypothetical protein